MKYKKNNRGFTLVELIVVLVILAVLAALLVPSLTGYIDKAKEKSVMAETRMILQAVQTEVSELYGTDEWNTLGSTGGIASKDGSDTSFPPIISPVRVTRYNDIVQLSENSSLSNGTGQFMAGVLPSGKVRLLVYNDGKGHIGFYHIDTGKYEVFSTSEVDDSALVLYYGKVFIVQDYHAHGEVDPWNYDIFTTMVLTKKS